MEKSTNIDEGVSNVVNSENDNAKEGEGYRVESGCTEPILDPNRSIDDGSDSHEEGVVLIGPTVPSGVNVETFNDDLYEGIGPSIPPGLISSYSNQEDNSGYGDMEVFGPMPPSVSDPIDSDDSNSCSGNDVGPMPFSGANVDDDAAEYARLRMNLENKTCEKRPEREEWMLKVPKKVASCGLEARQFKRRITAAAEEFDKSWEESPQAKRHVEDKSGTSTLAVDSTRDEEQRKLMEEFNVGRKEALVDAHQKAGKNAKVESSDVLKKRVPFDREKDLNGGDKKVSLNEVKSRFGNLDSRFSSGSGQRFL